MISALEIKELVSEWGLRHGVVEKDYVLGWLLWGLGSDPVLRDAWVFKGGTCLKKCYVETFRFSEDLDFTVLPGGPVQGDVVAAEIPRVLARVQEASGINFGVAPPRFKTQARGEYTQGRIYYRGPLQASQEASVILDLSSSEKVVRPTVLRPISHAFSDRLPLPAEVRCYAFEEVFAEKIRAMGERGRPRDLYDIVNLFRRPELHGNRELVKSILLKKCAAKGLALPSFARVEAERYAELEAAWEDMLGHQVQLLPPLATYWDELPGLFRWLEGESLPAAAPSLQTDGTGESLDVAWRPPPTVRKWGLGIPLESVRFAAANHLCIELGYQGTVRTVEPYSLRRTQAGNLLLFAVKVQTGETRAYRVDRIRSIKVTAEVFRPRFRIELGGSGLGQ